MKEIFILIFIQCILPRNQIVLLNSKILLTQKRNEILSGIFFENRLKLLKEKGNTAPKSLRDPKSEYLYFADGRQLS
ncbi:MAG: hypothetical protein EAX90_04850 [Candidatus Heimdallarchaeota archaeon]|nr:hypothetical protein [Candidatus Heimdallarchaeota archaeon]